MPSGNFKMSNTQIALCPLSTTKVIHAMFDEQVFWQSKNIETLVQFGSLQV